MTKKEVPAPVDHEAHFKDLEARTHKAMEPYRKAVAEAERNRVEHPTGPVGAASHDKEPAHTPSKKAGAHK